MAQIIEFPQRTSNAYYNLTRLLDLASGLEELNFYENTAAFTFAKGVFFPGEYDKLTEQIRRKRLDLSKPEEKPAEKADKPGVYLYCPEMGEKKPDCQIEAQRSYYGRHYRICTPLELKGRGITFDGILEAKNLTAAGQYKTGWREYTVTERAFEKLRGKYTISQVSFLD